MTFVNIYAHCNVVHKQLQYNQNTTRKATKGLASIWLNTKQKCEARDTTKSIWKQVYKDV